MKPNYAIGGRSRTPTSVRTVLLLGALLVGAATSTASHANESSARSTAEGVGHETGATVRDIGVGARETGREVGQGAAEAGRTIGHTVRDAAVVTWYHVKESGKAVGRTVRDGSKAFVRGLKGEPAR